MTEKLIDLRDGGSLKAHILLKRTDLDFVFFSVTVLSGVVLATAMVGWRFGGLEDSWRPSHDDAWSVRQLRPQLKLEVLEARDDPAWRYPCQQLATRLQPYPALTYAPITTLLNPSYKIKKKMYISVPSTSHLCPNNTSSHLF